MKAAGPNWIDKVGSKRLKKAGKITQFILYLHQLFFEGGSPRALNSKRKLYFF